MLKAVVAATKGLLTEANVEFREEGLSVREMDAARVGLMEVLLRREGFEEYECGSGDGALAGVNMGALEKFLGFAGEEERFVLSRAEAGGAPVLRFDYSGGKRREASFDLRLVEVEGGGYARPDVEYDARVRLPSAGFRALCRDLGTMGDVVTLRCTKEGVRFVTESEEHGRCEVTLGASGERGVEIETNGAELDLGFSLRYLNLFAQATPLSDAVVLHLSTQYPLVVEYPMGEAGYVKYYLAARVAEE